MAGYQMQCDNFLADPEKYIKEAEAENSTGDLLRQCPEAKKPPEMHCQSNMNNKPPVNTINPSTTPMYPPVNMVSQSPESKDSSMNDYDKQVRELFANPEKFLEQALKENPAREFEPANPVDGISQFEDEPLHNEVTHDRLFLGETGQDLTNGKFPNLQGPPEDFEFHLSTLNKCTPGALTSKQTPEQNAPCLLPYKAPDLNKQPSPVIIQTPDKMKSCTSLDGQAPAVSRGGGASQSRTTPGQLIVTYPWEGDQKKFVVTSGSVKVAPLQENVRDAPVLLVPAVAQESVIVASHNKVKVNPGSLTVASQEKVSEDSLLSKWSRQNCKRKHGAAPISGLCITPEKRHSKKPKLHEIQEPFEDKKEESRRLNAIHQYEYRQKQKGLWKNLEDKLTLMTSDFEKEKQLRKDTEDKLKEVTIERDMKSQKLLCTEEQLKSKTSECEFLKDQLKIVGVEQLEDSKRVPLLFTGSGECTLHLVGPWGRPPLRKMSRC